MSAGASPGTLLSTPSASHEADDRRPTKDRPAMPTRLIGLAGLLSFDLIVVATFVAPTPWKLPGTGSSPSAVAAYALHNATRITVSLFIYSLAMGLFLCFAAGLSSWFRQRESPPQTLSSVFAFTGAALVVLILAGFVPTFLLGYRSEPAAIAGMLGDLTFGLLALSGIPTAVFLVAYAALVIRLGGLPRWTAYLAGTSALAHVLIAASFLSHGPFLSLESKMIVWVPATFFAWILVASAALFWGANRSAEPGSKAETTV